MEFNEILEAVLKNPKTLETISEKVGLDKNSTKTEIKKALPALLEQLEENSKDSSKVEGLKNALEKKHSGEILDDLGKLDLEDGGKIISHIFGDNTVKVETMVGNKDVLKALGPIVMGALGKSAKEKGGVSEIIAILSGSSKSSNILVTFLDKDGDGDIKDDLFKMLFNWIKKNFFGSKK